MLLWLTDFFEHLSVFVSSIFARWYHPGIMANRVTMFNGEEVLSDEVLNNTGFRF